MTKAALAELTHNFIKRYIKTERALKEFQELIAAYRRLNEGAR